MQVKINGEPFFRITGKFQEVDSLHPTGHSGIDVAMKCGTPLHSTSDGVVEQVYNLGGVNVGTGVKIKTPEGIEIIYGHMQDVTVKVGDLVRTGQLIGHSGNTGHSTGCHLHLGAKSDGKFIDPSHWVDILQQLAHQLLDASWSTVHFIILFVGGG